MSFPWQGALSLFLDMRSATSNKLVHIALLRQNLSVLGPVLVDMIEKVRPILDILHTNLSC
jgi:hypothetical protein